jgi:hypothetical protein
MFLLMFLLIFLARGFALFADGPALVNSFALSSRSAEVVEARARVQRVVRMAQTSSAIVVTTAVRQ